MDLNKLLEPYIENGRTIGGQIKWLEKNGLSQGSIDYAMSHIYSRINNGEKFKDGDALDQELRKVALEYAKKDAEGQMIKRFGEVKNNLDIENVEWNKLSKWQKIKQVLQGEA